MTALAADRLHAHYGDAHVLRGVDLTLEVGEIAAVVGRNGVGKTTLVSTAMGLVRVSDGGIRLFDRDVSAEPPHRRARCGLQLVRQGRHVFGSLTVRENIEVAARGRGKGWAARVEALFPNLRERMDVPARSLSGGEQQMLAIARALRAEPRILLLDEPSEGLAPQVVVQLTETIHALREHGLAVLLVEQNLPMALDVADRVHVMAHGRIVFAGSRDELRARRDVQAEHLGV